MLRCTNRILPILALVVLSAAVFHAEGGTRFIATSAGVSGAGEAIKINVSDWSSDSTRDEFVAAWTLTAAAPQGRGGRGGGAGAAGRGAGGAGGGAARGGAAGRGGRGGGAAAANAPAATAPPTTQAVAPDLPADPDLVDSPAPAQRGGGRGGRGGGGGGAAPQTPESSLAAAIQKAPTAGILWTSENVGYSIKYAYRLPQADGGERIILVTDRRVGKWSNLWMPAAAVTPSDYPFSIIELRFNSKGEGEGRGVVTGKVAVDATAKTIALDNYAALPVILKAVKRQPGN
jgi:hypothetical protein